MTRYVFKLYVTGHTSRSQRAIANLRRICEEALPGAHEVVVIDVLETPRLAEERRVLATPTLDREVPLPLRRIIGDLSHTDKVLTELDLPRPGENAKG